MKQHTQATVVALAGGVILLSGGLFGIYFQGPFLVRAIPGPVYYVPNAMTLGLPAGLTLGGSFLLSWLVLASPLTAPWTSRRRSEVFLVFALSVLFACALAAWLAARTVARELRTVAVPPAGSPHSEPVSWPSFSGRRTHGKFEASEGTEMTTGSNSAALPPEQQSEDNLIYGAFGVTDRAPAHGEPKAQVSAQRLEELSQMPVSRAERFRIHSRLHLPGGRVLDLGTSDATPGQSVRVSRAKDFLFPTSVGLAQASEAAQSGQPDFPVTPTSPGGFESRSQGLEIEMDVTPAPGVLVLGGSVTQRVFEGFGRMPGEAFLPVVDTDGIVLTENRFLQPQFTTRETPFVAAATAGQPCRIPIHTSFGQTILELTCTPVE